MPRVLLTLILVCLASPVLAQVNAETLTDSISKPGWGGAGKSTINYASGNVNTLEVRGETSNYFATAHPDAPADAQRFWFRDRILVYGSAGLKKVDGAQIANDGFAHARYTRMQWLRFGGEVFAQAQYDHFRLLSRRLLVGAGIRAVFANLERFRLWFGTGALMEWENRDIKIENQPPLGVDPVNMTNPRSSSYLTMLIPIIPDHLFVTGTGYVQPRWDKPKDIQILTESRLQVRVSDHLSITTDVSVRYDSRPPTTVKSTDLRIGNGIVYSY